MHNLFTITLQINRTCSMKKVIWNFKQNPWRKPKKRLIISCRLGKEIHIHAVFKDFAKGLSNFVHDFWEDCFRKPELLLAANMLIYFNTSTNRDIENLLRLLPLSPILFLYRIITSRVKTRPVSKNSNIFS